MNIAWGRGLVCLGLLGILTLSGCGGSLDLSSENAALIGSMGESMAEQGASSISDVNGGAGTSGIA